MLQQMMHPMTVVRDTLIHYATQTPEKRFSTNLMSGHAGMIKRVQSSGCMALLVQGSLLLLSHFVNSYMVINDLV